MSSYPKKSQKDGGNHKKGKEAATTESDNSNLFQKIRIIYRDPDATDYSSEEEVEVWNNGFKSIGSNGFSKDILVPKSSLPKQVDISGEKSETEPSYKLYVRKDNRKPRKSSSIYMGVRCRPWGRFSSEIRDPTNGAPLWLGTYDTELEAAIVYSKKKDELYPIQGDRVAPSLADDNLKWGEEEEDDMEDDFEGKLKMTRNKDGDEKKTQSENVTRKGRVSRCSKCKQPGHNKRRCQSGPTASTQAHAQAQTVPSQTDQNTPSPTAQAQIVTPPQTAQAQSVTQPQSVLTQIISQSQTAPQHTGPTQTSPQATGLAQTIPTQNAPQATGADAFSSNIATRSTNASSTGATVTVERKKFRPKLQTWKRRE